MNSKRLHIHSTPIIVLAVAVTVVMTASVVALRGGEAQLALLRPALRFEAGRYGAVKVVPNAVMPSSEQPGMVVDLGVLTPSAAESGVAQASQSVDGVTLFLALRSAVR